MPKRDRAGPAPVPESDQAPRRRRRRRRPADGAAADGAAADETAADDNAADDNAADDAPSRPAPSEIDDVEVDAATDYRPELPFAEPEPPADVAPADRGDTPSRQDDEPGPARRRRRRRRGGRDRGDNDTATDRAGARADHAAAADPLDRNDPADEEIGGVETAASFERAEDEAGRELDWAADWRDDDGPRGPRPDSDEGPRRRRRRRGRGRHGDEHRPREATPPRRPESGPQQRPHADVPGAGTSPTPAGQRVVVLIDVARLLDDARESDGEVAFGNLLRHLTLRRHLIRAIGYCRPGPSQQLAATLRGCGIETQDVSDDQDMLVALAVDAMAMADRVDCVVLVPSPRGLAPLCSALRGHGIRVESASFSREPAEGSGSRFHHALGRECLFVP